MDPVQDTIIGVEKVSAGYKDTVILQDVSFDIERGEIFIILGASGSGKSTLLKLMIGLNKPFSGRIFIDGQDIVSAEGDERMAILRKFGVMYQRGALFGSMTLLENVRLPLEEFTDLPPPAMDLIARMKLSLVGLEEFGGLLPAELSGGMQKRAAIARAMSLDPRILFLDELSAGLDPITSAELDHLVLSLAHNLGITFVIVTHELSSIYAIADRVIMLDKELKGILAIGTPRDLRDHSENAFVRRFFNRQGISDAPAEKLS
jgi:phospholipid/cholesterol/gamma-HCH transport system ATP-binding protein